jgi:hypothetical protein
MAHKLNLNFTVPKSSSFMNKCKTVFYINTNTLEEMTASLNISTQSNMS